MRELLSVKEAGMIAFNVPAVITHVSRQPAGTRLLVQLLNYSGSAATDITIRVRGNFRAAKLVTPDSSTTGLTVTSAGGETDVAIPRLSFWGGVLLEGETP